MTKKRDEAETRLATASELESLGLGPLGKPAEKVSEKAGRPTGKLELEWASADGCVAFGPGHPAAGEWRRGQVVEYEEGCPVAEALIEAGVFRRKEA